MSIEQPPDTSGSQTTAFEQSHPIVLPPEHMGILGSLITRDVGHLLDANESLSTQIRERENKQSEIFQRTVTKGPLGSIRKWSQDRRLKQLDYVPLTEEMQANQLQIAKLNSIPSDLEAGKGTSAIELILYEVRRTMPSPGIGVGDSEGRRWQRETLFNQLVGTMNIAEVLRGINGDQYKEVRAVLRKARDSIQSSLGNLVGNEMPEELLQLDDEV